MEGLGTGRQEVKRGQGKALIKTATRHLLRLLVCCLCCCVCATCVDVHVWRVWWCRRRDVAFVCVLVCARLCVRDASAMPAWHGARPPCRLVFFQPTLPHHACID